MWCIVISITVVLRFIGTLAMGDFSLHQVMLCVWLREWECVSGLYNTLLPS